MMMVVKIVFSVVSMRVCMEMFDITMLVSMKMDVVFYYKPKKFPPKTTNINPTRNSRMAAIGSEICDPISITNEQNTNKVIVWPRPQNIPYLMASLLQTDLAFSVATAAR